MLYQMVELVEGVDVQYLGVYALKWQHEWGPPSVGFVERNVFDLIPTEQHERLLREHEALQELLAVRDSELEQCNLNLKGHRKANTQLKEDLRLEAEADRCSRDRLVEARELIERMNASDCEQMTRYEEELTGAKERIEALERRVEKEKAWAQHREDLYVAVRRQLRRAGVIKPHEEVTVEDAVERLLRQVPAKVIGVDDL